MIQMITYEEVVAGSRYERGRDDGVSTGNKEIITTHYRETVILHLGQNVRQRCILTGTFILSLG
jgi:hypothetical protein